MTHDYDDPQSTIAALDATMEAVHTRCRDCNVRVEVIPGSGTRFVLGITHEPGCPQDESWET